jgi:hypothetical protein
MRPQLSNSFKVQKSTIQFWGTLNHTTKTALYATPEVWLKKESLAGEATRTWCVIQARTIMRKAAGLEECSSEFHFGGLKSIASNV